MYQKILDARAELLLNKTNCFFAVLDAVAVIVAQAPGPRARFSKVPIINDPGKLSRFPLKIEVSIVLHLT